MSTTRTLPSPPLPPSLSSLPLLTRSQISSRIAGGQLIVLSPPLVYRIPVQWLKKHPGGRLALLHYVGRDASNEIAGYHSEYTVRTRMARWVIGRVDLGPQGWIDMVPPVQLGMWPVPVPRITITRASSEGGGDDRGGDVDPAPPLALRSPSCRSDGADPLRQRSSRIDGGVTGGETPSQGITGGETPPQGITGGETLSQGETGGETPSQGITGGETPSQGISGGKAPSQAAGETPSPLSATPPPPTTLTPALIDPPLPPAAELPVTPEYQHHLRLSFRDFHRRIQEKGLDLPPSPLSGYAYSLALYVSLFALALVTRHYASSVPGYLLSAVLFGLFLHQVTFVAHDAGHTGLTGHWLTDRVMGTLIANLLGGLSIGWWCNNHNVHHLVTNMPEHDPDIQHFPFFAITTKFFENLESSYYGRRLVLDRPARFLLRYQHKTYYAVMSLARFNLFALSYAFLLTDFPAPGSPLFPLRLLEIASIAGFYGWFIPFLGGLPTWPLRIAYLVVSFMVSSPLHVQIVLSHFSQPVSLTNPTNQRLELLESHAHRQLRTTMDISCPPYLDFLHGGLNFQVPHHLLPRTPRFQLRKVSEEVQQWCKEEHALVSDGTFNGIPLKPGEKLLFKRMEFVEANKDVLSVLENVATQLRFIARVAEADAKGELSKEL